MNNQITMTLNVDPLLIQALQEDITSEDITTNSVMRAPQAGEVQLICKQDGIIAGLQIFERVFQLLGRRGCGKIRTAYGSGSRRYPGAPFWRTGCFKLSPENERYRHLYTLYRKIAGRQQNKTSGYQKNHPKYENL